MLKVLLIIGTGALTGAALGYLGKCTNGQCPLTANPRRGALFGAVIALIVSLPILVSSCNAESKESHSKNLIMIENDKEFETKIEKTGKPCLVDFYADWCGPCKALTPTINQLADEFKDKAVVAKVNVDKHQALTKRFKVSSIPCVVIIKDGKEIGRVVGTNVKSKYTELLNAASEKE